MAQVMKVEGEPREEFGKNAARRLRRAGRIPAVVYGGGGPPLPIAVDPKEISRILVSDSGRNALFSLEVKGKAPARVMLKDWTVDPVKGQLLHVDMVRIARDAILRVRVPIHTVGEPKGVKVQGGIFDFVLRELEVECLPDDIPENVTVDITELTLGRNLRVAELPVGPKMKVLTDPARVVVHVVAPKLEEEKPAEAVAEAPAPSEPELIRKGKAEPEEGAETEKPEKPEKKESKKEGKKEKE
jgi:large subunit ribosomal protein L25